jgi:hypothetical protein
MLPKATTNYGLRITDYELLPPQRFRSGRLWITKTQINQMADSIVKYLKANSYKLKASPIAYVRGSYLEAVKLVNKKLQVTDYGLRVTSILREEELIHLKKKGIMWMKVGLRMPTPFIVFRMKIRAMVEDEQQEKQLKLLF